LLAIFRFVLVPGTYRAGRELGFASNPGPPRAVPGTFGRLQLLLAIFRFDRCLAPMEPAVSWGLLATRGPAGGAWHLGRLQTRRRCLAPRGTTAFASHFPVCTGAWHLSSRAGAGVCQQPWAPQGGAWHLGGLSLLLAIFRFVLVPGTYRAGRRVGFASNQRPPQAVPGT
jgi:hypothetical protein